VLVPYPQAAEDHQLLNAEAVSSRGACRVIIEADFTPATLRLLVEELVLQDEARNRMASAARGVGRPGATDAIGQRLLDLLGVVPTDHRLEVSNAECAIGSAGTKEVAE